MKCQAKHRNNHESYRCTKDATHYTFNDRRNTKLFYCEEHALKNHRKQIRKNKNLPSNSNPIIKNLN